MKQLFVVSIAMLIATATFTQDSTFQQMLDYSRPGKYHQLLANLEGNWAFKGNRIAWIDSVTSKAGMKLAGSLVRKAFANGRFFIAEITTAAKIDLPIQDGKMIKDYGKAIQMESEQRKVFQLLGLTWCDGVKKFIAQQANIISRTTCRWWLVELYSCCSKLSVALIIINLHASAIASAS